MSYRKRILAEKGFSKVEHYMFEEHEMLKRAATECMCNLVMCDEVGQNLHSKKPTKKHCRIIVQFCAIFFTVKGR
jgi:hypothetical protein